MVASAWLAHAPASALAGKTCRRVDFGQRFWKHCHGVIFVVGHFCSGASIPASEIYEAAGVLLISPSSSNPMLTELGRANVFRVTHRDDAERHGGR